MSAGSASASLQSVSRVRILIVVARVDFFQKGILRKSGNRQPSTKNSTLSESFPTLF